MRKLIESIPFAVAISVILISIGAVLASDGVWIGRVALGVSLLVSILYTGAAVRRRQRSR